MAQMAEVVQEQGTTAEPVPRFGLWGNWIAHLIIISVVSRVTYSIFFDPKLSPLHIYPQPFGAILFWMLMVDIWFFINFELWPFTRLRQPARGVVSTIACLVLTLFIVWLFNFAWGAWDPTFDHARADGTGYLAAGLGVLIGFFTWSTMTVNFGNWPWADHGLKQPMVGAGDFLLGFFLWVLGYAALIYPNLAPWATPQHHFFDLPTTIGWFYSVIVAMLLTGALWENWPWSLAGNRRAIAIVSLIGNLVLGAVIFILFMGLLRAVLIPADIQKALGAGINIEAAQLGVCFVWWIVFMFNVMKNWPTQFGQLTNYALRAVITFVLGVITYLVYNHWAGTAILHEPAVQGSYGGNPLLFMDWLIMILFFYVWNFGSWGLTREETD